jgi:regulator of protease activity HflC (stomatin/prohibitin superfamily)
VYSIYGQNPIREVARTVVTKYSIDEIMQNREKIGQELFIAVRETLKGSPITVLDFGFADLQPPQVIVQAQEARKEREVAILKADAEKQVKLKQAEAALEVAQKQQEVDLKEAETQVLVEGKLSSAVSEAFVTQRALKIWESLATNDAKTIIMPAEAIKNPALLMGTVNVKK